MIGWIRKWIGPLWPNEEDEELARSSRDPNTQRRLRDVRGGRGPHGDDDEGVVHQDPSSGADAATASESGEEAIPMPPPAGEPSSPNLVDEVESTRRAAAMADLLENDPQIRSAIERIAQDSRNWPASEEELEETARLISPYIPKGLNPSQVSAIIREEINRKPTMTAEELAQAVKREMDNRQPEITSSVLKAIRQDRPQPIPPAQADRTSRPRRSATVTQRNSPPTETPRGDDDGFYRRIALALGVILVIIAAMGAGMWISNTINDSVNRAAAELANKGNLGVIPPTAAPAATTPPAAPNPTAPAAVLPPVGGNSGVCDSQAGIAAHDARIIALDPSFRSGGWQGWMKAAGMSYDAARDARQPEVKTIDVNGVSNGYVLGLQIVGTNIKVNFPNGVTTDVASRITRTANTFDILAEANTGSRLYTNVIANGPVTIYADVRDWGQFISQFGCGDTATTTGPNSSSNQGGSSATGVICLSKADLKGLAQNGNVIQWLKRSDGSIGGAQLRLNKHIDAVAGSNLQRNGNINLPSAEAGQIVSYWMDDSCNIEGGGSATTFRIGA